MTASDSWPPIGSEDLLWEPSAMTMSRGPQRYRAAIPSRIASLLPAPVPETSALADLAAQELSRFDAELGHRISTFAPVLLRSEAASSSQIENLTASARAIFSAELGATRSRHAIEIAANTRAMATALDLAEQISTTAILQMHAVLLHDQPRHTPGRFRDEAVWIGTRSDSPVGAEFVGPSHERIVGLIEDALAFARRTDIPVLTAVAVAHAQFETIHPFSDGNGRTGRALAQAMLRYRGTTRNVAVPVSAGLLADVEGYHRALTAYRAGDVSPIIAAFANAALRAVANARELVRELDAIRNDWDTRLHARKSSNAWRLLDVLLARPVVDSATAADALGVRQPNVYPPLQSLVDAGILKSKAEHRLGPYWRSDEVLAAIDRFAERAGRRQKAT
ncbi:Fic family protein [Microbacterium sp. RURRCA19A]|uniref:Fic family protein n=1 Tax=Microbacterium sp. RURRCA19A TaxID=1907391 RepID=UPI0009541181|nr:Fic family protein [Microbacterium sp. RURRCA19A]SIS02219.1 Fic family protein [Microbacterium sp. RURRCA19A]